MNISIETFDRAYRAIATLEEIFPVRSGIWGVTSYPLKNLESASDAGIGFALGDQEFMSLILWKGTDIVECFTNLETEASKNAAYDLVLQEVHRFSNFTKVGIETPAAADTSMSIEDRVVAIHAAHSLRTAHAEAKADA